MYGVPPQRHLQGQTRDNSNTRFFHTKKEHIDMCSYIIEIVEPGGAHDREGDLSYAKSFIDSHLKTLINIHVTRM